MYKYIYIYRYVYIYTYIYIYKHIHTCMHSPAPECVCAASAAGWAIYINKIYISKNIHLRTYRYTNLLQYAFAQHLPRDMDEASGVVRLDTLFAFAPES